MERAAQSFTRLDSASNGEDEESLPDQWDIDSVAKWLTRHGFEEYVSLFCAKHKIDGKALLTLSENDLRNPPLEIKIMGDVKRLAIALRHLQATNASIVHALISPTSGHHPRHGRHKGRSNWVGGGDAHSTEDGFYSSLDEDEEDNDDDLTNGSSRECKELRPEAWKALVAMFYFFTVTWITAFTMVIVHDRVPDMQTYPPLPDIFLDNVPLIPWAFKMCELCGLILFILWCTILVFHKHRFILLRRMFSLFGSVFLLRCVTMLITSLSVPGRHLQCKARPYGSWSERLYQAYVIWQGGGMSLQGVRTCGDYMFSGHTVVLTLLNFFITECKEGEAIEEEVDCNDLDLFSDTPPSLYYMHTLSWVLNLFGVFFILAGHEHYSIDVFIAFYISTRLFLYYHTLANNRALYQGDRIRTRIWFPLFYFFESNVNGIVPNLFETNVKKKFIQTWKDRLEKKLS